MTTFSKKNIYLIVMNTDCSVCNCRLFFIQLFNYSHTSSFNIKIIIIKLCYKINPL